MESFRKKSDVEVPVWRDQIPSRRGDRFTGGKPCVRCSVFGVQCSVFTGDALVVRWWITDRTSCAEGLVRCLVLHEFSFWAPSATLSRAERGNASCSTTRNTTGTSKWTSRRGATKRVDCAGVLLAAKSHSRLDPNPGTESCSRHAALVVRLRELVCTAEWADRASVSSSLQSFPGRRRAVRLAPHPHHSPESLSRWEITRRRDVSLTTAIPCPPAC